MKTKPDHWIEAGKKHLAKDIVFRGIIKRHADVPLLPQTRIDLLTSLTHAIVNQQLSGKVATVIFNRVRDLFPRRQLKAALVLKIPEDRLRKAGLSWNKIRSIRDLSQRIIDGRIPASAELFKLTDDALIERLTEVYGIGPWTVQMLLIFKLGRPDVFPANDLGIQKGFQKLHGRRALPKAKHIERHSHRWKPYRTLAAWYLWRAADEVVVKPVKGKPLWTS
jgi:DNA-3-methyladenine glycosylase II